MNTLFEKQHEDALKLLHTKNIELNCYNDSGVTPLMWASSFSPKLAEKLIEMGADIMKRDYLGSTALIYAVHGKKASTALLLINKGIDINIPAKKTEDSDTYTAIDFTYDNRGSVVPELQTVHDVLLKKGAKPNEQTLKRIEKARKKALRVGGGSYRKTRKLRKNNRMTRRLR
jgi:ankyrin repeat protein